MINKEENFLIKRNGYIRQWLDKDRYHSIHKKTRDITNTYSYNSNFSYKTNKSVSRSLRVGVEIHHISLLQ